MANEYEKYLNQTFESKTGKIYTISAFINKGGNGIYL